MFRDRDVLEAEIGDHQNYSATLGQRLRQCRKERGLTMTALGSIAQCSQSFLSKVEGGDITPSLPMLHRLARALGIRPSFLVGDGVFEDALSGGRIADR